MQTQIGDEAATSRFVQAGDVRMHYNEVGTGAPVIMLHGTGPGASSWSNFSNNVEAFAGRFRALLVDMPQYGKSQKVVIEGGRLTYTSRVLQNLMDALHIERAHFVGNSMGGQVAIKLAIDAQRQQAYVSSTDRGIISAFTLVASPGGKLSAAASTLDIGPHPQARRMASRSTTGAGATPFQTRLSRLGAICSAARSAMPDCAIAISRH